MKKTFVIVTPAYNEVRNIGITIQSVVSQTVLPRIWVIVDDGSEDGTWETVRSAAQEYPWIRAHRRIKEHKQDEDGLVVASEAKAFLEGYDLSLRVCRNPDFIVKLDADLKFAPNYFERIFDEFALDPTLGIAGGVIYELKGTDLVKERVSTAHVRGATKIYKAKCYEDIGGVHPVFGWDVIDEILARNSGWNVSSFEQVHLVHLRRTASRGGRFKGWARNGYMAYYIGMSPLRIFLRVLFRLIVTRDAVQCFGLAHGYFSNYFRRAEKLPDREIRRLVRQHQWVTAQQSLSD